MIHWKNKQPQLSVHEQRRIRRQRAARDSLWVSVLFLVGLLGAGLFAALTPKTSPDYPQAQGTLFIGCTLAVVSTFALMRLHRGFLQEVMRVLRNEESVTDSERSNALWILGFILALVGLLFVDMSFFQTGGLRITVVIGTAFGRALWAIIRGR